jgi:hypothetical protein
LVISRVIDIFTDSVKMGPSARISVRFDDKLTTVFAQPADDSAALSAVWMQIVDILAQDNGTLSPDVRSAALQRLFSLRAQTIIDRRYMSALSVARIPVAADLVALFGADVPRVAAPVLMAAHLTPAEWIAAIPAFPPASRALLRERRDLDISVQDLLSRYGLGDFALPSAAASGAASTEIEPSSMQIRDLVARIEAFRKERGNGADLTPPSTGPVANFRFETNSEGLVHWVDDAPRGPIIGIDIATMAQAGDHGVDGHAAGAFKRRTPFRNARMIVPGAGPAAGDWRISGLPYFNDESGRFLGYRCTARRPHRDERPSTASNTLFGPALSADALRQLVHELRTPLNAIRGFAEMISGQLLGPASAAYRNKASDIIAEAQKLLALFDDLDVAARLERGVAEFRASTHADMGAVLQSIAQDFLSLTDSRHVHLRMSAEPGLPNVAADAVSVERMLSRILAAVIGLASPGETIAATLVLSGEKIVFSVDRPKSVMGLDERALLDPAYGPTGEWPDAPALGLGFTLRLVANIAKAVKGSFDIADNVFSLSLPVLQCDTSDQNGTG